MGGAISTENDIVILRECIGITDGKSRSKENVFFRSHEGFSLSRSNVPGRYTCYSFYVLLLAELVSVIFKIATNINVYKISMKSHL